MVGPTARAISTEEAIQDIRYPDKDKSSFSKELSNPLTKRNHNLCQQL